MSSDPSPVVIARGLAKSYTLYPRPSDRFAHLFMPWRKYPTFDALKDVTFTVERGETVGIIGQNGAGKSTLLQLVTGIVAPTAGEVRVSGRVAALLELGAGFEPDFTGRENILLNGTILGLSSRELKDRTDAIIAFSELGPFIDRPVRTYSSGMFMRLAFSVAAHVDADLLIIDEALSVGDVRFTQKCLRFLKEFKQRGSILFVSHDLGSVTGLCDKAIWLDHGRVRGEGPAIKICEQYVGSLFDGVTVNTPVTHAHREPAKEINGEIVLLDDEAPPQGSKPGTTSISAFNPDASTFGSGGAAVIDVGVFSPANGERLSQVVEGQEIDLRMLVKADVTVERPIMGFYLKDRLGQLLMGDNSYWDTVSQPSIPAGDRLAFRFRFNWPALARGTYTLTVALADGVMEDHIQRHWLHDAVILEVLSSSSRLALVGVQLRRVLVDRNPPEA
jgi:lipopolysaccharide transport system ATP-binding protein